MDIEFPNMPSPAESLPSSQVSQDPPQRVAAVLPDARIQVPAFWRTKPREWFAFVRATLRSHGWRAETRIRDAIIANLPEDVLSHLGEGLLNLDSLSLARLEDDVCAAHRCPEAQSRLDVFLDSLAPGAMEPASALRSIREFCGGANAREDTLFTFLKRILHPAVRQQMAAFTGEPIDDYCRRAQHLHLAQLATATALPAVRNPAPLQTADDAPPPYSASRAAQPEAHRSPRRSSSERDDPPNRDYDAHSYRGASPGRAGRRSEESVLCPQHQRFGRRAQRCDPPCAWRRLYARREAEDASRAPAPPRYRQQPRGRSQNGRQPRSQRGGRRNRRDFQSPEEDRFYEASNQREQGNY